MGNDFFKVTQQGPDVWTLTPGPAPFALQHAASSLHQGFLTSALIRLCCGKTVLCIVGVLQDP